MTTQAPVSVKPATPPSASVKHATPPLPVPRFIGLLSNAISVLLMIRVALILLGANIDQPLTAALMVFTQPFVTPFEGIFAQPVDASGIVPIDLGAILGIFALQFVRILVRGVGRRVAELP